MLSCTAGDDGSGDDGGGGGVGVGGGGGGGGGDGGVVEHYLASGRGAMMNDARKLITPVKSDSLN